MPLLLALLLSSLAVADPTALALGPQAKAEVQLLEAEGQIKIKLELPGGALQAIPAAGDHWVFLRHQGDSKRIVVQDFDGDGRDDFVVRSGDEQESRIYAYHYDARLRKFVPFLFADDDHLNVDHNETVEVSAEGITFAAEEAARKPWRFSGKRFLPF